MQDHDRHIAVEIRRKAPQNYAQGGLAQAAKSVADHGVGGDTMIVHMNKGEFDEMRQRFGDPTINPHTGMPQFTPFYKQSWFAPVAGVAGSLLGGGNLIGDALNGVTGGALGSYAGTIGSGLLGAGIGALSNGGTGALMGGLAGAGTNYITGGANLMNGMGSGSGLFGSFGGGAGGTSGASPDVNQVGTAGTSAANVGGSNAFGGGSSGSSGIGMNKGTAMNALMLAALAGNFMQGSKGNAAQQAAAAQNTQAQAQFNKTLPPVQFNRTPTAPLSYQQAKNYGYGPAQNFFTNNQLPGQAQGFADGGAVIGPPAYNRANVVTSPDAGEMATPYSKRAPGVPMRKGALSQLSNNGLSFGQIAGTEAINPYASAGASQGLAKGGVPQGALSHAGLGKTPPGGVAGPGDGRSDHIPAMLSDGEYVMTAEDTALLGNGSSKAGAQALDRMRENLRKHKGGALAKGKFSPDAKSPEQYMGAAA